MFVFCANGKHYAFEMKEVQEVAELRHLAHIPKSPKYVSGAINYKGALYCIVNTPSLFGFPPCNALDCDIIILSDIEYKVGFLAEKIIGIVEPSQFCDAPKPEEKEQFVKSCYALNNNEVKLINVSEVFNEIESAT